MPLDEGTFRLAATLVAVATLAKLYDAFRNPGPWRILSLRDYVVACANWFWLVQSRKPEAVTAARDRRRLLLAAPTALIAIGALASLFFVDWSQAPFWVEHCAKVIALFFAVTRGANAVASVWKLCGGEALHPMYYPELATTPAEFWRRWNRPAQQFFREYAYLPAAASWGPLAGILAAFVVSGLVHEYVFGIAAGYVQGRQLSFFSLHGVAAAATWRWRPRGFLAALGVGLMIAFGLATSTLLCENLDAIVPFYYPRPATDDAAGAGLPYVGDFSSSMPYVLSLR